MNSVEQIMAPCIPQGEVNEAIDGVYDDDSKDAWCRCPLASCCVDGRGYVLATEYVFQVGGQKKVAELIAARSAVVAK
jgi:hypothetical protein